MPGRAGRRNLVPPPAPAIRCRAIWGAVMEVRRQRGAAFTPHCVTTCIEHPAVLETLAVLAAQGLLTYTAVPVSSEGVVSVADVAAAFRAETVLLTVMHSNNEVGSLQPVAELAALARRRGVLMHSDAAQVRCTSTTLAGPAHLPSMAAGLLQFGPPRLLPALQKLSQKKENFYAASASCCRASARCPWMCSSWASTC